MRISRAVLLAGTAGITACAETSVSEPTLGSVQGVAQDSLAGKPAAGVVVQLGSSSATTDFLGAYQFANVAAGNYAITVNSPGFEAYAKPLTVSSVTTHNIPLRRLAPYLKDFAGSSNSSVLTATYIDLQGASTIVLSGSFVTISGNNAAHGAFTFLNGLGPGSLTTIDAQTARVSINTGETGIQRATWNVKDSGANSKTVVCTIGSSCVEQ